VEGKLDVHEPIKISTTLFFASILSLCKFLESSTSHLHRPMQVHSWDARRDNFETIIPSTRFPINCPLNNLTKIASQNANWPNLIPNNDLNHTKFPQNLAPGAILHWYEIDFPNGK
jgi:hypothetical protein